MNFEVGPRCACGDLMTICMLDMYIDLGTFMHLLRCRYHMRR